MFDKILWPVVLMMLFLTLTYEGVRGQCPAISPITLFGTGNHFNVPDTHLTGEITIVTTSPSNDKARVASGLGAYWVLVDERELYAGGPWHETFLSVGPFSPTDGANGHNVVLFGTGRTPPHRPFTAVIVP